MTTRILPKIFTQETSSFVKTHCQACAYGWQRQNQEGGTLTYCLLDREQVFQSLTSCSRYELPKDTIITRFLEALGEAIELAATKEPTPENIAKAKAELMAAAQIETTES
jgi:hypothetical protein